MTNFVLLGWLLGTKILKTPMWMVIITNITNIVLRYRICDWPRLAKLGAALTSLIADYAGLTFGNLCLSNLDEEATAIPVRLPENRQGLSRFVKLNRDIFLRSLCLQATFIPHDFPRCKLW